jgi:CTP:molybdopterin cytidylyltransferase MocA
MGQFKPLLDIGGQPMIRRVVDQLRTACRPVIVVTGHRADEVQAAIGGSSALVAFNPHHESGGMVSSAQVGVRSLAPVSPAFVLSLGDQPAVRPETLSQLINAWKKGAAAIAVPAYHAKRGHPIVMSMGCAADVLNLKPDETLKTVVERYQDRTTEVPVDDPGIVMDVDTPTDYQRLLEYWDEHHPLIQPGGAGHGPNDR